MKKWEIDVPVLLIFFNRPDTFKHVFEKVKLAKPSKLFLASDGPRNDNPNDYEKNEECKKIAQQIDWDCEVHMNYSNVNLGCGVRPQTAITWALSIVDRVVVLEDDCVPDLSFFNYMAELLEKYKDDQRIGMISGLNHFKDWDCGDYSYCFTKNGAIWGWGTWRRVWNNYDYSVSNINDPYVRKILKENLTGGKNAIKKKIDKWVSTNELVVQGKNITYWDFQFGFLKVLNSYLAIVPKHNLICNIGVGEGATHFTKVETTKWKKGMLHYMPTKTIESPLKHPPVIMCDNNYTIKVDKTWGYPNFFVTFFKKGLRFIKRLFK